MPRPKRQRSFPPAPALSEPVDPPSGIGAVELLAFVLVVLAMVNAWAARYELNPDGVSYLDLAGRLAAGDVRAFVQGYWSPAYPALIALAALVGGPAPTAQVIAAHLLNAAAAIGGIAFLWWWGRNGGGALFGCAALAAFSLVSYGLPRIEAVTPDVLLLALTTWVGYELLARQGVRWARTGSALGLLYLVKTGAWPWLLLSVPLRIWGARDADGRQNVLRSVAVTAAIVLLWVVPLSIKAGHPTFGSTGRLNYCWYILACDSRTPDDHQGGHTAYHQAAIDSASGISWAEFDGDRWTYAPWSDPTAWQAGVLSQRSLPPEPERLLRYWGEQGWRTVSIWLLPVLGGLLIPWSLLEVNAARRRWWSEEGRPVLVVGLLGVAGILQFILVHAEPRLLAPFALLLALAIFHGGAFGPRTGRAHDIRRAATWLGVILVAYYGVVRVREVMSTSRAWEQTIAGIADLNAEMAAQGLSQERVVVLGPALPVLSAAFYSGAHVIAQFPSADAGRLAQLPASRRAAVLAQLFGGRARIAWYAKRDGVGRIEVIPAR